MTIEQLVIASGINAKMPYMQTITTGAMLFLAILLQSIVLSLRRGMGFKLYLPQWLRVRGKGGLKPEPH